MSKKKSFSGSTMTLKDFHGGSIPSDLPLPSAPGVSVRPPDRWGPPAIGIRPDSHHRQRPGSAGSCGGGGGARLGSGFGEVDERGPPFLSTPANIGRQFDEDERKPFDASAAFPRRPAPVTDPVSRPTPAMLPARSDPKPQGQAQPQARSCAGPTPNAWGLRKEEVRPAVEPAVAPPPVQASSAAVLSSRFAQASAVDKISSGRWQTKPITPPTDVEVIRFQETVRVVDKVRVSSPLQQEVKERVFHNERVSSPLQQEVKESGFYNEEARPVSNEGMFGGGLQQQQQRVGVDVGGERPKLKLLPRTRPMDANEIYALEVKQGHQPTVDPVRMENSRELQGSMNIPRPGSAGADVGGRVSERPKLNLKPRSLPVEHSDESTERERKSVFGGARPRELVLKERGIDDIASANPEVTSPAIRLKSDIPKTDMKPKLDSSTLVTRHGERPESYPVEQRSGRDFERKDSRSDQEKVDGPRASWRNDNWKNNREIEKPVEQHLEPDTWRKPVEEPKPEVHETASQYGKAASALELAQAFSRSVSDTRPDNRVPDQRSVPGRVQVPFSRLTDIRDFYSGPNPRQINGY